MFRVTYCSRRGKEIVRARCQPCHRRSLAKCRAKHGSAGNRNRVWKSQNPEKARAHKFVDYYRSTGKLVPQPCEACGADGVQAHHEDYSKPLDVRWLCPKHHAERHKELRRA